MSSFPPHSLGSKEILAFIDKRIKELQLSDSRHGYSTWVFLVSILGLLGAVLNELRTAEPYPPDVPAVILFLVILAELVLLLFVFLKPRNNSNESKWSDPLITTSLRGFFSKGKVFLVTRTVTTAALAFLWYWFRGPLAIKLAGYFCVFVFLFGGVLAFINPLLNKKPEPEPKPKKKVDQFFFRTFIGLQVLCILCEIVCCIFSFLKTPSLCQIGASSWKIGGAITVVAMLSQFMTVEHPEQALIKTLALIRNQLFFGKINSAEAMMCLEYELRDQTEKFGELKKKYPQLWQQLFG